MDAQLPYVMKISRSKIQKLDHPLRPDLLMNLSPKKGEVNSRNAKWYELLMTFSALCSVTPR